MRASNKVCARTQKKPKKIMEYKDSMILYSNERCRDLGILGWGEVKEEEKQSEDRWSSPYAERGNVARTMPSSPHWGEWTLKLNILCGDMLLLKWQLIKMVEKLLLEFIGSVLSWYVSLIIRFSNLHSRRIM